MTLQPLVEPVKHDDVTLRPDERLRLGSIVANWDDGVKCNASRRCDRDARWVWHCACGAPWYGCDGHRSSADALNAPCRFECVKCSKPVPCPIPWLPL